MKKKIFFAFIVAIILMTLMSLTAFAASESEPNETASAATSIQVNTKVNGKLSGNKDVDWYKFTTTTAGYFYIDFQHDLLSSSSTYWQIYLYDSTGVNNIDGSSSYFGVAGNANCTTNCLGIPAGTYYIKVKKDYYSENDYSMTVNFIESTDWETENNNSMQTADVVTLNKAIHGSLSMNGDVDWYKITTTTDGYFYIDFQHTLLSSSSTYWQIYLYDSTGVNNIDGSSSYYTVAGNANCTTNCFGVPAGTYYIKVKKDYYSGNDYSMTINFIESTDWETENNSSASNANIIQINHMYYGALSMNGDVDWYKFSISNPCEIAITFNHETLSSSSTYWKLYLYDSSAVTQLLSYGRRGDTETATTDYLTLSPGTYYIKVSKDYYSGANYSFVIQERHDCYGNFLTTKNPTCTETGFREKKCVTCGKILATETIPATGHSLTNWVVDITATCTNAGKRHAVCTVCGETVTENVKMQNHEYGQAIVEVAPTCHSNGKETKTCKNCGYSESTTVQSLTHVFSEWYVTKEATCYESGTDERKCSLCGDTETRTVKQLTHEYGEWTVVSGSKLIPPIVKEKTCVHCGDVQSIKDWSYVWVTIVAGVVLLGVLIGVINYIRAFKKR